MRKIGLVSLKYVLVTVSHVFLDFLDKEEYDRVKQMKYFDEIAKNGLM